MLLTTSGISFMKIKSAIAFRNTGCQPSGPGDFPGFKSCSFFKTVSGIIEKLSSRFPVYSFPRIIGKVTMFSSVNIVQKKSLRASAFSLAVTAELPFDRVNVGILLRALVKR